MPLGGLAAAGAADSNGAKDDGQDGQRRTKQPHDRDEADDHPDDAAAQGSDTQAIAHLGRGGHGVR
jgi:hypothetical protein